METGTETTEMGTAGMGKERHVVISELREAIRKIERRPARRGGVVPCGRPEIDGVLPGGGFPRGALTELAGGPASGKTAAALSLLSVLGPDELFAWIDTHGELYPPAAAALGVDLGRLLLVRPPAGSAGGGERSLPAVLWAAEALLASGAFAAVAVDAPEARLARGGDAVAQRLRGAAEKGGAVGLWLSKPGAAIRVPAAVRLELTAVAGRVVASRRLDGGPIGRELLRRAGARRSGHAA
jgi:protein ImuA